MTDDKLNELFTIEEWSESYTYANISSSSNRITPMLRVLLLPTVQSPTDEPLAWNLWRREMRKHIWRGVHVSSVNPLQPTDRFKVFLHLSCLNVPAQLRTAPYTINV